jgi:hypothetical protein
MRTWERPIVLVATVGAAIVLAACGADEPAPDDTGLDEEVEAPTLDDDDDADEGSIDTDPDPSGTDPDADPDGTDPDADDPGDTDPSEDTTARADDDTALLAVEPTSDIAERDARDARLIVTDVRVGAHDGFDRIVIELAGEGEVGWFIEPTDEPRAQGSGMPIEVDGDATLLVAVRTILLPGDEPDAVDPATRFEADRVPGTGDGPVLEVVRDTLFEGIETYAIGLDEARPYRVERFADPERVVIDVESS